MKSMDFVLSNIKTSDLLYAFLIQTVDIDIKYGMWQVKNGGRKKLSQ